MARGRAGQDDLGGSMAKEATAMSVSGADVLDLLQGELAAIETYNQALASLDSQHDESAEAKAQRTQPPPLHRGQAARDEPETDSWLAHARAPDDDQEDKRSNQYPLRGGGCLCRKWKDAGRGQRDDRDDMPAPREGDDGVSVEEERVGRGHEAGKVDHAEPGHHDR